MISLFIINDNNLQMLDIRLRKYISMKIDFHHIGIVLDMQCPLAKSVLKYVRIIFDNELIVNKYFLLYLCLFFPLYYYKTIHYSEI